MLYFAYGSNMLRDRMIARVGRVHYVCSAHLNGYRLAFSKGSIDGSGKCTMVRVHTRRRVWGVVYDLTSEQKLLLDDYEGPDYGVEWVGPRSDEERFEAFTYIGRRHSLDHSLQPYSWYKGLVLAGAVQAGLPMHYIAQIRKVSSMEDDDRARARVHLELMR